MFGHLQVYSAFSFQESTLLVSDIVKKAIDLHMDAVALTDSNMYGMIEFYKLCTKNNIKPILGLQAMINVEEEAYPFILLAIDTNGYYALCRYSTLNSTNQTIDIHDLIKDKDHLYVLTPGNQGLIERLISKDLNQTALRYLSQFDEWFDGHFCINLHKHSIEMQNIVNDKLLSFANMLNIKVVCSNNVAYLSSEDAYALDLINASKNENKLDLNHIPVTNQRYFKSEAEMKELFDESIIASTSALIDTIHATIPLDVWNLPSYPVPQNKDAYAYLKQLCITGLKKRFNGKQVPRQYVERLKHELQIINEMHYNDYFLIVWDYVRYAKTQGILVGPGRGSAAGSLVSYVLGITNCDPLKYDLLFERFLNPERVSMPDIDIDFQDNRRDEVIDYVIQKYGQEHVCGIVTFNTYGPRVAIKDLGKVLNVPLVKLDRLSSMVPTNPKNKKSAYAMYHESAAFYQAVNAEEAYQKMIHAVFLAERLPRNISQHAAGIILSKTPLSSLVPMVIGPSDTLMTQYSKDYIEDVGLLKMDFLGLRNLTTIDYILKMIEKNKGIKLNLNNIDFNDPKVFELIARGDTFGVFQLESEGMKQLLVKMKVDRFDDIVAANALFRPGPMDNIPLYLDRKQGKTKIDSLDPSIDHILKSTYGIIIYQEQIMMIATTFASFTLGKADTLRKAVSKKGTSLMLSMKDEFIEGAIHNGHSSKKAEEIFALIEKFANYGFNKSHSVAYSYIAYQMAYLKVYYPLEFFAALISSEAGSDSSKLSLIHEGKRYGVELLPPSINKSTNRFEVEGENIRYSLTAIKNVGLSAYQEIKRVRPFLDLYDFFIKIEDTKINDKVIESLIDAGALDEFNYDRKLMKGNIEELRKYASLKAELGIDEKPILRDLQDSKYEKLELEKNVLGIYLSKHPLVLYKEKYGKPLADVGNYSKFIGEKVISIVSIQRIKVIRDKKGQDMCFIGIYDESGNCDAVLFNNEYSRYKDILKRNAVYIVEGKISMKNNLSMNISKMKLLSGEDK